MRLVALAKERVIDEREFLDAQSTLSHIADAVKRRVEELQGMWNTFQSSYGRISPWTMVLV